MFAMFTFAMKIKLPTHTLLLPVVSASRAYQWKRLTSKDTHIQQIVTNHF